MPWTVDTYAGTKATGSPSNARVSMFELCRAVNERQGCIQRTKTQFYRADGTTGSDLPLSDFLNMYTGPFGGGDSLVKRNMELIQTAIRTMCTDFTWTLGGDDPISVSALEAEIGTDLTSEMRRVLEARFWQAQHDALNQLVYARRTIGFNTVTGFDGETERRVHVGTNYSAQDAWTSMLGNIIGTGTATNGSRPTATYTLDKNIIVDPDVWGADTTIFSGTIDISLTNMAGTINAVKYNVSLERSKDTYFSGELELSVAGNSEGFPFFTGLEFPLFYAGGGTITGGTGDLTLGSINSIEYSSSLPSTVPFSDADDTGGSFFRGRVESATIYYDVTGQLTDQDP